MKTIFLIACFCFLHFASLAQGGGPVPDPDPTGGGVPIDGGIGWLAAAGVAYGVKKLRDKRNSK
jgi:hypothetical protein